MMRRRLPLLINVDDLARQFVQIWQEIPQEIIRELHHSMPRRVAACIQGRRGVETSVAKRCHEDQVQDALDKPVVEKTATSLEMHAYSQLLHQWPSRQR
ncbi:hypothetical protein TNCV_1877521 [Trichonephila clavipes]|nr:hypothetical protein TNCV_1877521 [Trichonephila clavipes]